MGSDKALLQLDGITLLERTVRVLRACCDDVTVIGWERPGLDAGAPFVLDDLPDAGPLAGIATALRVAQQPRCLMVACDMPRLSVAVLQALAGVQTDADVLVPWSTVISRHGPQGSFAPLHAIYTRRCLPVVEDLLALGQRRVVDLLEDERVQVQRVPEAWLLQYTDDAYALANVNDPDAWQALMSDIEAGDTGRTTA